LSFDDDLLSITTIIFPNCLKLWLLLLLLVGTTDDLFLLLLI
jgi:hypothetical protein